MHWRELSGGLLFGRIAALVRKVILARAVGHYTERFFPPAGVFVEAGCGTGQASAAVDARGRKLVALDFSLRALVLARRSGAPHSTFVLADLAALPFYDQRLAGIWNLGVMEHFPAERGVALLGEMRRSLRPGGVVVLFWPPELGASRWVLAPVEWLRSIVTRRRFRFFPDEVNRLRSRRQARETLVAADLEPLTAEVTWRDAFIHMVVVGRRGDA